MKSPDSVEEKPPLVSVIIPCRNEFPQICFTLQSIINDLETFLKPSEFEIIIMVNCPNDEIYPERQKGGSVDFLMPRGAYWNRMIKVIYDPIAGNHSTRNKGVLEARGKYIFLSDAHMSYKVGYHQRMIRAVDETGGLVHGTIGWLGGYPPGRSMGYQYTIKLGEEIKGTWNNYKLIDAYF
jgi:glycosyltransferase involved in cell wall biosynthesis